METVIFVDRLRELAKEMPIGDAAEKAVESCIRDHILEAFLRVHKAEVIEVSIFYYDEEKEIELIRQEERKQGVAEGIDKGLIEGERIGLSKGLAEGERIGIHKGERIGMDKGERLGKAWSILTLLKDLGTVPEELKKEICAEQNDEVLTAWLKLASKAERMEDFLEKYRAVK